MRHQSPWIDLRDIPAALGLLTRIPVRFKSNFPQARGAHAAWAYPLVGVVVGGVAGLVLWLGIALGLSAMLGAGCALAVQVLLTGALHEDGLADTADGFWGGHTLAWRLEIMKDSQIGTYGVLALLLCVGMKWVALGQLAQSGIAAAITALLFAAVLGRAAMLLPMHLLPHARKMGLSASVGRPSLRTVLLGYALATALGFGLLGWNAGIPTLVALAVGFGMCRLATVRVGGQTGDILGATQVLVELATLLLLTSHFG